MADAVYVSAYGEPPVSVDEIMRYAGAGSSGQEEILQLARECAGLVRGRLSYKVCWREFPVAFRDGYTDLGFARTDSLSLRRHLDGCERIVLFAATVGLEIDRLTARYKRFSPARALMLQAVGAERIEALCDLFCEETAERLAACGVRVRPRFSPGYGDLPIEMQRDIFRVLDCQRKIGLTLNGSLLMSPTKSVTAIIGAGRDVPDSPGGCAACPEQNCQYRKERFNEDH